MHQLQPVALVFLFMPQKSSEFCLPNDRAVTHFGLMKLIWKCSTVIFFFLIESPQTVQVCQVVQIIKASSRLGHLSQTQHSTFLFFRFKSNLFQETVSFSD